MKTIFDHPNVRDTAEKKVVSVGAIEKKIETHVS